MSSAPIEATYFDYENVLFKEQFKDIDGNLLTPISVTVDILNKDTGVFVVTGGSGLPAGTLATYQSGLLSIIGAGEFVLYWKVVIGTETRGQDRAFRIITQTGRDT